MPYSFRNRDEIRAPSRLDDLEDDHRKASYREPDVDEDMYRSSPPKSSRMKYRGPVTHFNPKLPPAAFPTLNDPTLARYQQPQIIEDDCSSSDTDNGPTHDRFRITGSPLMGRHGQNGLNGRTSLFPTIDQKNSASSRATPPNTAMSTGMRSPTDHLNRQTMRKNVSWLRGLRPQHDGTTDSILEDNMRRMHAAGKLTSFDRNMLEMMSSEDEDEDEENAPQQEVRWDDLAAASKLQLYDVVADAYPSEASRRLQLKDIQVEQLMELLLTRNERLRREDEEGSMHRREVCEKLLRGARMSRGKSRELVDLNLFQHVQEGDEYYDNGFLSQAAEVEKARLYLAYCRLNPKLLKGAWASIPEANAVALGGSKGNNPSVFERPQQCKTPMRHSAGRSPNPNASLSTPSRHRPPRSNLFDASDDSRSPRKPRLHARMRTPPHIQRSPNIQREPSQGRQVSGFIRPSTKLDESTVTELRLPPIGDFVHRPDLARIELIRARKAAIEANRTAIDRQVKGATSRDKANKRKAAPSAHQQQGGKRRASTDLETSFLNNERRPGARQPKLTEKAVDAEVALQSQSTATAHKKKRTCGGSTKEVTPLVKCVAPAAASRNSDGTKPRVNQTNFQKPIRSDDRTVAHRAGEGNAWFANAMTRKDSAIDLTADEDDEVDVLG